MAITPWVQKFYEDNPYEGGPMYGQYGGSRQAVTFTSGASKTSAFDTNGASLISLEFPTFGTLLGTTTANVYIEGAQGTKESMTTFRRVVDEGNYSAGAGIADWEVPSTTGNRTIACRPLVRFNYGKIHLSTVATDGMTVWVHKHQ